jgi:hypothetical protein
MSYASAQGAELVSLFNLYTTEKTLVLVLSLLAVVSALQILLGVLAEQVHL